ncbi:MAG: class I SAM-dependent methyltransferase [Acidobacteriaceae bacterium]
MALAEIYSKRTAFLNDLFCDYHAAPFWIQTPNWHWASSPNSLPAFVLRFRTTVGLESLFRNPTQVALGEAFVRGDIDIEGDIYAAVGMADYVLGRVPHRSSAARWIANKALIGLGTPVLRGRLHSRQRDRAAIAYHYDRSPGFFRSWLGNTMVYSCAYFRDGADDLDTAQENKLDLICRKLELRSEDSFLDIGCGWGSLVLHAVSRYGAVGRGITLSAEQARFAAHRLSSGNLTRSCFVEVRDYRDLPELPYRYDKMASVGMFEHVGPGNLSAYFAIAYELLKPGGFFLNSGIARSASVPSRRDSFIAKYVFPDGDLVPLCETIRYAEQAGFEVRDVENLREHYMQTLRLWVRGLQKNAAAILNDVSEEVYRIWLLYVAGSALAFERGDISVNQVLLRRPARESASMPRTRERWCSGWNVTELPRSA